MLLFVYGSLLRGLHNHRCLNIGQPGGAVFIKEDFIKGKMYSNHSYPFIVLDSIVNSIPISRTNSPVPLVPETIKGEIYAVPSFEGCDRLEGY